MENVQKMIGLIHVPPIRLAINLLSLYLKPFKSNQENSNTIK